MARDVAILIHGTFASRAEWVNAGSAMANAYADAFGPVVIDTFRWSGNNNHASRIAAGRALARHIARLAAQHPGARLHVAAHSHGGNVALYALRDLDGRLRPATIAFLGTPFLKVVVRNSLWSSAKDVATTVTLCGYALLLAGAAFLLRPALLTRRGWHEFGGTGPVLAVLAIGFLMLLSFGCVRRALDGALRTRLEAAWREGTRRVRAPAPTCPVFVARSGFDEAGWLLSTLDRVAFAPRSAIRLLKDLLAIVALAGVFGLFVFAGVDQSPSSVSWRAAEDAVAILVQLGAAATVLLILAGALATGFAAAIRGSRVAFGGEGPFFAAAARVVPMSDPPWPLPAGSATRSYRIRARPLQWRHSTLYIDRAVLADLSAWLATTRMAAVARIAPARHEAPAPRRTPALPADDPSLLIGCVGGGAIFCALTYLAYRFVALCRDRPDLVAHALGRYLLIPSLQP